jgi:virginiamycin B lyase
LSVLVQIAPNGATRLFASLPGYTTRRIAYDQALKKFFFTYAASSGSYQSGIAAVDRRGNVTFVAGGGPVSQTDGTGAAASFSSNLGGITVDTKNGNLYVNDGNFIRAVTPSGTVTTLTQPGAIGGQYNSGISGVAYSSFDDALYVADSGTTSIKRVVTTTGSVSVLAGQCLSLSGFNIQCDPLQRDGLGARGLFGQPTDIVVDPQAKVMYVSDAADASIRRIDALGNVSTLAGNGVNAQVDGAGPSAEFTNPAALVINPASHGLIVLDLTPSYANSPAPILRAVRTIGATPPPANTPITLFDPMSLDPGLFGINWLQTAHPPAALVYDGYDADHSFVGLISTAGVSSEHVDALANESFPPNTGGPFDVRYAYNDTQWTFENSNLLGRRALAGGPSGVVIGTGQAYTTGNLGQLAPAPNGDMWFVIPQTGVVGHVTPAAHVYTSSAPSVQSNSASIAFASNGNPWVVTSSQIIEFALTGKVLIDDAYSVKQMTTGPDGNIWFTQSDAIGTIRPDNTIVLYPIFARVPGCAAGASCSRQISAITTGPDGALWVTELGAVARLTTNGVFSEFPVLAARTAPSAITSGPDGNIWFIDAGAKKIGRLAIH